LGAAPAGAQSTSAPAQSTELKRLNAEIELGQARLDALNAEAARLDAESQALKSKLIDAAAAVQTWELRLDEVEARLYALLAREHILLERLKARRNTIAELLGALESLELNRPPALAVTPKDATAAARSAMLLSALIPAVHAETDALERELNSLQDVRTRIRKDQQSIVVTAQALEDKKSALEALLDEMTERRDTLMLTAEAEQAHLNALAAQARDLRGLLSAIAQGAARVLPRPKPSLANVAEGSALSNALGFTALRGKLKHPVVGEISQTFQAKTATGVKSRGLVFTTRAGAQVISPCDGTVAFAGPYLDYGQLLIIAAGDGYHVLLSGMSRVDGVVGQRLLAGEPVGQMGGKPGDSSKATPELYVEIRRNGEPVDPLPWLAESNRKVSG
jgi:septal ring factor EnvC (AmiA/AmiB activator)